MPPPVVAWLANVLFVAIPVIASFLTLSFVAVPPSSLWEALFESHKVILVAAVTLSGVALVEVVLLAFRLGAQNMRHAAACLIGVILLVFALIVGVICYLLALVNAANPATHQIGDTFVMQLILGLCVLLASVIIALRFKYIDYRISALEAATHPAPAAPAAPKK